jgi:signal transduction histidine kinase
LALYMVRLALSVSLHLNADSPAVEFTTVAVFLIPVVYAALNYGLSGALFTSLWVTLLAVPRLAIYLDDHNAVGAWAEVMQVAVLNVIAALVGGRVSSERSARLEAETAEQAHLRAEALYRNLFDSNQAPILIINGVGEVVEANASAYRVFPLGTSFDANGHPTGLAGPRLVDVIGADAAGQVLTHLVSSQLPSGPATLGERVEPVSFVVDGEPVLFRPTATTLESDGGSGGMQVVFEDVTAETRRHERMEAYAAQVVLAQEEERRHIAQDLHDGPVQTLIHLCRQIDTIESASEHRLEHGPEHRPEHADNSSSQTLSDLRIIVEGTVAELRGIAKGLRPSILDDLGLVASISQMLADAGRRNTLETSIGVTGYERRLPPAVELALFRISQEALSNVERHAHATKVAVGIDFEANGVRLLIRDDGIGIGPVTGPDGGRRDSLGLPGMAERANLIDGTFVIHSDPGGGTTVDIWVPVASIGTNRT